MTEDDRNRTVLTLSNHEIRFLEKLIEQASDDLIERACALSDGMTTCKVERLTDTLVIAGID